MPVWRLLVDGPVQGATNMALDRAVQRAVESGQSPPTLRLYRWARPTVTLGRFQEPDGVDLAYCAAEGIDVVRRFTGGRGVLHDDELTYSVVAGVDDGIPRGVAASYRHLSAALAAAYGLLGVDASITRRDSAPNSSSACYLATSRADLSAGDSKLAGSAQVWLGGTVMQHGSFTMSRDQDREARVFRLSAAEVAALEEHTLTITQALGHRPDLNEVESAIIAAFSQTLDIVLAVGRLSEEERAIALSIESEVVIADK